MPEPGRPKKQTIYTVGHGERSYSELLSLLRKEGIQILADIRSVVRVKNATHFSKDNLADKLPTSGITYHHLKDLGARGRKSLRRSPNTGLSKAQQGYADYMLTEEFERALMQLLALSSIGLVAILSAEKDPGSGHQRFLSDALTARGVKVIHLIDMDTKLEHHLPARIEIKKNKIIYPAPGEQLSLFD